MRFPVTDIVDKPLAITMATLYGKGVPVSYSMPKIERDALSGLIRIRRPRSS
jgi:hypothetical protein